MCIDCVILAFIGCMRLLFALTSSNHVLSAITPGNQARLYRHDVMAAMLEELREKNLINRHCIQGRNWSGGGGGG